MAYRPPQRAIAADIFSLDRWMRATFHLPKLHSFEDHLARGRAFFPLTDVALLLGGPALEFLALRASAAHVVVPEANEQELYLDPLPEGGPREVSCYLEHVAVHGTLDLLPGVRTSDFLANQRGFITLRGCRIVPPLPGRPEPHPVAFVNAGAILAVAEEGGHVGDPADAPARSEPVT
jgi:hypothetical protein